MMPSRDLKFSSDLHGKVLRKLLARYDMSERKMKEKHTDWDRNEEDAVAYMPQGNEDRIREKEFRRKGTPDYRTIYIPYSYAMMMTAHTYWTSVFLARNPVLQFTARRGENKRQIQAVESTIDYQLRVGDNLPQLFIWLLDKAKYGVGILGNYWAEETEHISRYEWVQKEENGVPIDDYEMEKVTEALPGYQGNRLYNVRPQEFYPDPRVPMHAINKMEFVIRFVRTGWNTVLKGKEAGQYFNIEELKKYFRAREEQRSGDYKGSSKVTSPHETQASIPGDPDDVGFVPLYECYVELVPKEWGLGRGKMPEKWVFTVADKKMIIGAQPLGLYHNRFPFFVDEYEIDGHSLFSRSMQDVTRDLNDTLTWLVNSHFHNLRQALNNQFIYDPSKVVAKDLMSGKPGFIARAKPAAYGTDIRQAIHQIPVQDVTGRHLDSAQEVIQLMQRVTGVNDNVMGMVDPGGRKTATEIRTSSSFSVNRLKTQAEWSSAVAWGPMAQVMVQNTQQFYQDEQTFRIAGNLREDQHPFLEVTPDLIQGFFDFVPVDGTLPVDRYAQAMLWQQLFETLSANEQLAGQFDMVQIFLHIANLAGAKNADQFKLEVRSDEELRGTDGMTPIGQGGMGDVEQLIRELQGGNGAGPASAGGGDGGVGAARGSPQRRRSDTDEERLGTSTQIPGMGPAA